LAHVTGTGPDDWAIVAAPLAAFFLIVGALIRATRTARPEAGLVLGLAGRASATLERVLRVPGWAAGAVATGVGGLAVAAIGFYWDVAWHIDLGRDTVLFTPPHTMILAGLLAIPTAGLIAILLASATKLATPLRLGAMRIPRSAIPLLVIGGGALLGFPLDELWHRTYGIDVTMWGPTHLLMIGGAAVTPLALWLVLADAGVRASAGVGARLLHGSVAAAALTGLSALQGEFDFGVPQFQLLYHPVLILIAGGIILTASRIAFGRGGALRAAIGFLAIRGVVALVVGGALGHTTPHFALYLGAALAVEAAAALVGTDRPGRFALAAAAGVGTLGLGTEWAWTQVWGRQPWSAALLPDVLWVGAIAVGGATVVGVALGRVLSGDAIAAERRVGTPAFAGAVLALAVAMALPFPRTAGNVVADLSLIRAGTEAVVDARLSPADAAANSRWFEMMSWQGGRLVLLSMIQVEPGHYRTAGAVPIAGSAKTLLRLHRGAEMMAVPVYMPADPEIGASEIPAKDGPVRFVRDQRLLMREAHAGSPWPARFIYAVLAATVVAWLAALTGVGAWVAGRRRAIARRTLADRSARLVSRVRASRLPETGTGSQPSERGRNGRTAEAGSPAAPGRRRE
jgi:hypothetical protein